MAIRIFLRMIYTSKYVTIGARYELTMAVHVTLESGVGRARAR